MLTYLAIATKFRPKWLVWENVPGVLSSNGGLDFASLLRGMGECGYGFAYRILDAQYFGVAQRRKRVFVVGCLGDWRAAAAVLFERHSLSGYPAPRREKKESVTASIGDGAQVSHLIGGQDCGHLSSEICGTIVTREGTVSDTSHMLMQPIPIDSMNHIGRGDKHSMGDFVPGAPCYTLTKGHSHAVAQPIAFSGQMSEPQTDVEMTQTLQAKNPMAVCLMDQGGSVMNIEHDMSGTLRRETHGHEPIVMQSVAFEPGKMKRLGYGDAELGLSPTLRASAGDNQVAASVGMAVRRLTPVECERLQGFPDNYTDIQPKGKATPDGPRYKALGNSMAVPVMAWIGKRIQEVEQMQCKPNR